MIRMIIADDEPVIIRGIQKLMDWENLGIEIVGTCCEGEEALDSILSLKPDIALLDIAMPRKTGIEILKKLQEFNVSTNVIFISGYQNFSYAHNAIKYGAVDYLLKPVMEDELMSALEKCIQTLQKEQIPLKKNYDEREGEIPFERLSGMEHTTYLPAIIKVFYGENETAHARKLIHFSVYSYLEQQLQNENVGIIFEKNGQMVVVLKGMDKEKGRDYLYRLKTRAEEERHHRIGVVVGNVVEEMSLIPEQYQKCKEKERYFYFADALPALFLDVDKNVFVHCVEQAEIKEIKEAIYQALIKHSDEMLHKEIQKLFGAVCILADGRKEDACFHLCSSLLEIQNRLLSMKMSGINITMKELLAKSRELRNYSELKAYFSELFEKYREQVQSMAKGNEKTELARAKEYIEEHYMENISLEILAREVHMNPYYFSAYFKKGTGKNFKDYLNEVRLNHAISLLVTTDKLNYEIATEVGYRDSRVFADTFQRWFGETPTVYRKRVKGNKV